MDRSARFRINAPRVIHEPFEHEIILVNLDTGRYYCLQKTGVDLWNGLMDGASVEELIDGFTAAYDAAPEMVTAAIVNAVETFAREDLVVQTLSADRVTGQWRVRDSGGHPFEPPVLETYTDMQDLLLLDPIHEVDEAGWPVPAYPAPEEPSTNQK
jgi:hypothetical protein